MKPPDHVTSGREQEEETALRPLSDLLVRDLTAHRTLALRLALGENPDVALVAVTHALAAQTFYRGHDLGTCLDLQATSAALGSHADGIEDSPAAARLAERHGVWAQQVPRDPAELWAFLTGLDHDSRAALFAHCAALTVMAVRLPWDRRPRTEAGVDTLATALALDLSATWQPTVRSYFGRVPKARVLEAVREAVGEEAAARLDGMKKQPMAESAEQLVAGTGWLPLVLRTVEPSLTKAGGAGGRYRRQSGLRHSSRIEAAGRGAMASRLFFVSWEFSAACPGHAAGALQVPALLAANEIAPSGNSALLSRLHSMVIICIPIDCIIFMNC